MDICHDNQQINYHLTKTQEIYHLHSYIQIMQDHNIYTIISSFYFLFSFELLQMVCLNIVLNFMCLSIQVMAMLRGVHLWVFWGWVGVGGFVNFDHERRGIIFLVLEVLSQQYLQQFSKRMKFTHNALTSIMVQKVENITTSMTRAGLGDDTYRRQRQKQRYLKYKQQQSQKQQKMRQQFLKKRNEKIKQSESLTQKRHAKRQKKKERQKQLKKKMKFIKKLDKGNGQPVSEDSGSEGDDVASQQVEIMERGDVDVEQKSRQENDRAEEVKDQQQKQ